MPQPVGDAFTAVESAMRFRAARQAVLAANVANVDTPRYRRVDLEFDAQLANARSSLVRTDPRHLAAPTDAAGGQHLVVERNAPRPDGNGVNPDREVIEAARNAGSFREQAEVYTRLFALRNAALGQR